MSVKINLHKTHRASAGGLETVDVDGRTVGECLDALIRRFPEMEEKLFAGKGKLLDVIEIYLNLESAYPNELARPVKDGDEIYATIILAGG